MNVRLPLDANRRNAMGAVSTSPISPGFDKLRGQIKAAADAMGALDPVTVELVRWRNGRRQDCQLCQAYRDPHARARGLSEDALAAVDDYEHSALSERHKLVLRFVDAYLDDPTAVPDQVMAHLREAFTPEQRVQLVLSLFGTTQNRVLRALGLDQGPVPV